MLCERIRKKIPLNKAIVGDVIQPVRKNIIDNQHIIASKSNIEKVNKQIIKNKAVVTGLLVGCDSVFSKGEMREIEQVVIEREKISRINFIFPLPYLLMVSVIETRSNFFRVFSLAKSSRRIFGRILNLSNFERKGKT